jgi:hypothetical protein
MDVQTDVIDEATRFVEEAELVESIGSLARMIARVESPDLIEMEARNLGRAIRAELRFFRGSVHDTVYDGVVSVLRDHEKAGAVAMASDLLVRAAAASPKSNGKALYSGPCAGCGAHVEGVAALGRYAKRCPDCRAGGGQTVE